VRRAFHLLEDNSREFPSFVANRMGLGVLHAVVGSVPENLKWGASLSGMEGSITGGLEELQGVMKYAAKHPEFEFGQEAAVMYAFVLLYLGQQDDQAWAALKDARLDHRQNPLAAFLTASMCIRTGRNDEAISTLLAAPRGEGYHPFAYLDYLLGCAKLYRLDNDAEAYLKRYVNKHPGRHYIKECYRNLAWSRLLQGDQKGYFAYLDLVKSRGYSELDADAKALREAELREVPNLALLKARLLCDGGYFKRANDLLKTKGLQDFSTDRDLIELAYRQGRIYQGLGEAAKALREFDKTIAAGKAKPYYFACNAALQAGILCEKQGLVTKARQYFEQCLEMKPDEYRNSLHQKAKAGINRLKR
jgi:tetratricopeptide (TPR) repeat protein